MAVIPTDRRAGRESLWNINANPVSRAALMAGLALSNTKAAVADTEAAR